MRAKFYLWVWQDVLYDYTSGMAFAIARTAEEAASLVQASGACGEWDGVLLDGQAPQQHPLNQPFGYHIHGGG